jgi:hypothetical protein
MRTGALIKACLIFSNDSFASGIHLISTSFFNISVISLIISVKLGINLLKMLILPMKDWIDLLFLGMSIFWMAFTLSGSLSIPSGETICPESLPSSVAK